MSVLSKGIWMDGCIYHKCKLDICPRTFEYARQKKLISILTVKICLLSLLMLGCCFFLQENCVLWLVDIL